MSKFLSRAAVLTLFLLALFSCRNETFFSESQNSKREEEFFKNALQKTANLKNSQQIINALISKNETSHFVSKLQDNIGLPHWSSIKMLKPQTSTSKNGDEDSSDGIYVIPLTTEQYISSLLLVELEHNKITQLQDITNDNLWDIINNPTLSKTKKENLLALNLYLDREIYGDSFYINIPPGLLGIPENYTGKIRIKPTKIDIETQNLMTIQECITTTINCNCPFTYAECDTCNKNGNCVTVSINCSYTTTPGGGESFPPSNGGGSSGGSNGGGGGNGGQNPPENPNGNGGNNPTNPPKDPCSPTEGPFYRPMPGCDGEPIETPCEIAKIPVSNINNILKNNSISPKLDNLKNYAQTQNIEYGVTISQNSNGTYSATDPYTNNLPGQVNIIPPTAGNYIANAHSHPDGGASPPSIGDFYHIL